MGKTKTAVLTGVSEDKLSGEEKYKKKQLEKSQSDDRESKIDEAIPVVEESKAGLSPKSRRGMRVRGKNHKNAVAKVDKNKLYEVKDAVSLVKETSYSSFDGTVEFHATVKKESLSVNVTLPHSTGKTKKVEVADEKTLANLKNGVVDFDVLLATADMMPKLVQFAKLLGPRGLMPNPKTGTLLKDIKDAKKFSADALTIKTERKAPIIHVVIGKVSQKESELVENLEAVIKALGPKQVVKGYLTSTMGPSVKVSA